jgi:hypothetical protein
VTVYYENHAERLKAYAREHYRKNKLRYVAKAKRWKVSNRERYNELTRLRRDRNPVVVQGRTNDGKRKRRQLNPEKYRQRDCLAAATRYREDIDFRVRKILRARIYAALNGLSKSACSIALLGCSITEFRKHIEARWLPGMTWANYGKGSGKWEIDHVVPCDHFDLSDSAQQRACFHFTNCQPLWGVDNRKKNNRLS